jgi:hypothetical protein
VNGLTGVQFTRQGVGGRAARLHGIAIGLYKDASAERWMSLRHVSYACPGIFCDGKGRSAPGEASSIRTGSRPADGPSLVDYTGRLFREGKAVISAELAGILDRLGCHADGWQARLEKLRKGRLFGRFFASSREKLREMAARLKVRHLVNLA